MPLRIGSPKSSTRRVGRTNRPMSSPIVSRRSGSRPRRTGSSRDGDAFAALTEAAGSGVATRSRRRQKPRFLPPATRGHHPKKRRRRLFPITKYTPASNEARDGYSEPEGGRRQDDDRRQS